jgi:hypothetical protein
MRPPKPPSSGITPATDSRRLNPLRSRASSCKRIHATDPLSALFIAKRHRHGKGVNRRFVNSEPAQANEILLRRYRRLTHPLRVRDQPGDLIRHERMMIGKDTRRRDVQSGVAQSRKETFGIADAGESKQRLAA